MTKSPPEGLFDDAKHVLETSHISLIVITNGRGYRIFLLKKKNVRPKRVRDGKIISDWLAPFSRTKKKTENNERLGWLEIDDGLSRV